MLPIQTKRIFVLIAREVGSRFAIFNTCWKKIGGGNTSSRAPSDERANATGTIGAKDLLLEAGQAIADLGGLFKFEIARVLEHLLFELLDLARKRLL